MSDLFSPISVLSKLSLQKAQRNFDEAKSFLNNDFRGMAKILSQYNPLELMKMALWEERRISALSVKDEVKKRASVLLPIILQSLVESDMVQDFGSVLEIKEKDWSRLKDLSEDSVRRLVRIIDSLVSRAICKGDVEEENALGMRKSIEKRLLPDFVDKESQERDIWQLRALLEEIPDFSARMGCDYISFVLNIQNISRMGLNGIDRLVQDVALYKEEYSLSEAQMRSSGELDGLTESQVFEKITKANHWEGRAQELSERRDGYSLFMPKTSSSLPLDSFAQYSIKPSSLSMDAFLSRGYWPCVRYPFFEYNGEIYSFVSKHIPFFLTLSSNVDRFLSSSRDILSIFHLSDCDTYVFDGNKIEISILPSILDVNPVLYPSSYSDVVRRRKREESVQRKIGHKKLVVDPDMETDMEKKDEVLYISSSLLSRATVDKVTRRDILSSLLGNLELPQEESVLLMDSEDEMENTDVSSDDILEGVTTDEYEYSDVDEDEMARKLDERDENITLVEYNKTLPTEEEKQSLIDRYSLPEEIIRKTEEEEKEDSALEDALYDDIFDDSEEEEQLDDLYSDDKREEDDYYEEVESSDEYEIEEKEEKEDDGQLDFFSILDEEVEFDKELEEEDEKSFVEEEKKEEELDSLLLIPGEEEIPEEEVTLNSVDCVDDSLVNEEDVSLEQNEEEEEVSTPEIAGEETSETEESRHPENPVSLEETEVDSEETREENLELSEEACSLLEWKEEEVSDPIVNEAEDKKESSPKEEVKPNMSFAESLFAALGDLDEEEEDLPLPCEESSLPEVEEESESNEEVSTEMDESVSSLEEEVAIEEENNDTVEKSEEIPEKAKGIVGDIYRMLGSDSSFSEFVRLSDEDTLEDLDEVIESCWKRQQMEGRDKLFNIPDYSLSILLARDSIRDELRLSELINNAGGVMYSRDCEEWKAVIVYIDSSYKVEEALEKVISKETFSPSDWKRVTYIGEQMKKR